MIGQLIDDLANQMHILQYPIAAGCSCRMSKLGEQILWLDRRATIVADSETASSTIMKDLE